METTVRWAVRIRDWHPSEAVWNFMLNLIPPTDQQRVKSFKFPEDRQRHLISQLLQRKCIAGALDVPWDQIQILRTMGKKPWVFCEGVDKSHAPNFNFNVSHEGDYVALASEPVCICGVDVSAPQQFRNGKKQSFAELLKSLESVFTASEVKAIRESGDSDEKRAAAFRRHWSLKEAYVKARGDGLGFDLARASFTMSHQDGCWTANVAVDGKPLPRWRFFLQELSAGHWVAVSRGSPQDIVDAWGEFTDSLEARSLSESQLQQALGAPNPPFSLLQPADLVPEHRQAEFQKLLDQE